MERKKEGEKIKEKGVKERKEKVSKNKRVRLIKENIVKTRTLVKKSKLKDAKRIYMKIIEIYLSLEPKEQAYVCNDIKELYHERKKKEK